MVFKQQLVSPPAPDKCIHNIAESVANNIMLMRIYRILNNNKQTNTKTPAD